MLVTFRKTRTPEGWRQGIDPEPVYVQGCTYDLPEAVARHWIGRGVAVPVAAARPEPASAAAIVPIPDDWKAGSADQVKALAATLTGEAPRTRAAAEAIVQAELDRRAAAAA